MTDVYVDGTRFRLSAKTFKFAGGEAEIHDAGNKEVIKIYKPPTHVDFAGNPAAQKAAAQRITEHQRKLPAFPATLPPQVIAPRALAYDSGHRQIVGYRMPFLGGAEVLLSYTHKSFRAGVPHNEMRDILRHLHTLVEGVHRADVVIGDFNDLNVLVTGTAPYLIDADSMQFGTFPCTVFTPRFADPLRCDPGGNAPKLVLPHNPESDWFAFAVMLFQCFLFTSPYGGVHMPKNPGDRIPPDRRALKRVSVFNPDVRYPRPAIPYGRLPDDLLHHLQALFEKDVRGTFPLTLLEQIRWTACTACGTEHARATCPHCTTASPLTVKETTVVRGTVTATRVFQTPGTILTAAIQQGKFRWLYHEHGAFYREDRRSILNGQIDPKMRYRVHGAATLFGKQQHVITLSPVLTTPERFSVDITENRPMFDANGNQVYWIDGDALYRTAPLGPERIGDVLSGLTRIWSGPGFGFGFYRAGQLNVAFVFGTSGRSLNDNVKIAPVRGQLVDASCVFTNHLCWFFTAAQENGQIWNRCSVVDSNGNTLATAESAASNDQSWLSHIRGGAAAGQFLLVPTDDGIVRVEPDDGQLRVTKTFPDTEPFVDTDTRLFVAPDGVLSVRRTEIYRLTIK